MVWDADKIRDLRLRMGLSQSDLARRLRVDSQKVTELEMGLIEETPADVVSGLDLLLMQAEEQADEVSCESLAEIVFSENDAVQVDANSIRRKFLDQ